jgi:TusA-related sulfurtransferase
MDEKIENQSDFKPIMVLAVGGLNCPLPLLRIKKQVSKIKIGELIQIDGVSDNFLTYLKGWCERNNHSFFRDIIKNDKDLFFIKKG